VIKLKKKILALVKGGEDVIFLSDIKLNSGTQTHAIHDIEKIFFNLSYKLYHNSTVSTRGVGILVKNGILKSEPIIEKDGENNIILLKAELLQGVWILGSVYGPNENTQQFYTDLENKLTQMDGKNLPVILGGDWNSTWDPRPADSNIDILNMANIPSKFRTDKLLAIAKNLSLTDPYRILHPVKREFTYVPNARMNLNRSRIDYFLIKSDQIDKIIKCDIAHALSSTSFDHKKFQ
jgi:exonuclease III